MSNSKFQKLGRKWRKMSKKLKATFSRPASDKETKLKKEPQETPSQKSVDQPTQKVESNNKSCVEAEIESEIEVEQGVDVDQIHLMEKKSSHHGPKKTKKNPRLVFNLSPSRTVRLISALINLQPPSSYRLYMI